jgi:hypothetical protein
MHKNNYHVEFKRQNSAQLTLMESPLAKLSNKKNPAEFRQQTAKLAIPACVSPTRMSARSAQRF